MTRATHPGASMRCHWLAVLVLVACEGDADGSGGAGTSPIASGTGGDASGPSSGASGGSDGATTTSTAAGGPGSGGADAGGAGGGGGGETPADACASATPTCDVAPPLDSGGGLVPLDRCAFALERGAAFDSMPPLVDALEGAAEPVGLDAVLADLNRAPIVVVAAEVPGGPPGVSFAFRWEDDVNDGVTWVPQGISGSADATATGLVDGRRVVLVSSYFDEDAAPAAAPKGVRLAVVDVTDPDNPAYRFLLLVEPLAGADWRPIPIHAGGIAWVGDHLYVADTFAGLRVFDMRRIFRADTSEDVIGCDDTSCKAGLYKFALPQIGAYTRASACDPAPRYSFVALDRSGDVPAIVTGEYCSGTSCDGALHGRLLRHAVDPASGLLAGGVRTFAEDAFYMGERQVQGAVCADGTCFLSSSEPPGGAGALYRVSVNGSATLDWIDTPEDVMIDRSTSTIWSLSEGLGERFVFAADLASYR